MKQNLTRRSVGALAVAMAAGAPMLAACSNDPEQSEDGTRTLRLALGSEPSSFDPALQISAGEVRWLWGAVFDTLLRTEADGTVVPHAAEEFELNDDATELTMTLRDNMTFSDGTPVDSPAVKASIEHMQESGGPDSGRVAGVDIATPDDRTVVLTTPRPTGQLPTFMTLLPGAIAQPDQLESDEVASNPISSGPYVLDLEGTTSGSTYRFEKRDDYWDASSYAYDVIELVVMTEETARLNALMSAQVNGAILSQEQVTEAESAGIAVLSFPGAWAGFYLNDRDGETVEALGDVRVRQAINMAFDRESIAENTYGHGATPTTQIFHPDSAAYLPELDERYPYDVEAARSLMAEAGYENGFQIEVHSQSGSSADFNPIATQYLAELNIELVEVPLSGPSAQTDILSGRFPAMYQRMGTTSIPLFGIVEALEPGSIWNVMDTEDPELQPLLDRAQTAQEDEAVEVYKAINEYVVEQAWFAPWVVDMGFFALSDGNLVPEMTDAFNSNPLLRDFV